MKPRLEKFLWVLAAAVMVEGLAISFPGLAGHEFTMNYLWFHSLAEGFTVIAALFAGAVFLSGWRGYRGHPALGAAFLTSAILDTVHLLTYGGMPETVFYPSVNGAIYFWLAARLAVVLGLLTDCIFHFRSRRHSLAWAVLLAAIYAAAVYYFGLYGELPRFASVGSVTLLKIAMEYLIIASFFFAGAVYLKSRGDWPALFYMLGFITISILSEFSMTLYPGAFYFQNFLGHVYKITAYAFLFAAARLELERSGGR